LIFSLPESGIVSMQSCGTWAVCLASTEMAKCNISRLSLIDAKISARAGSYRRVAKHSPRRPVL
jgi:hypothetical protein